MPKFKIDDRVIDTTEFIKGTGTITNVTSTPTTGSIRYHVDFKDTKESGWFREEELQIKLLTPSGETLLPPIVEGSIREFDD